MNYAGTGSGIVGGIGAGAALGPWGMAAGGLAGLLGGLFGGGQQVSPELRDALRRLLEAADAEKAFANSPLGSGPGEMTTLNQESGALGGQLQQNRRNVYAQLSPADAPNVGGLRRDLRENDIGHQVQLRALLMQQFGNARQGALQRSEGLLGQAAGVAGQFPAPPNYGASIGNSLSQLGYQYGMQHALGQGAQGQPPPSGGTQNLPLTAGMPNANTSLLQGGFAPGQSVMPQQGMWGNSNPLLWGMQQQPNGLSGLFSG